MDLLKKVPLFCFLLLFLTAPASGFELKVITEDFAPFNYVEKGAVTGFTTEIVRTLIEKTGVRIARDKILFWPWKRAYQAALSEENVLLFTTTRTPKREALFKWVGPIYPRQQWMFRLGSRTDIKARDLESARRYKVAEVEDSANYQTFVKNGFVPGKNLVLVNTWNSKINMLLAGRVDMASFLPLEFAHRMRLLGKEFNMLERMFLVSGEFKYFLAFSRGTPDSAVTAFQQAYDGMKADGSYDRILKKYMK